MVYTENRFIFVLVKSNNTIMVTVYNNVEDKTVFTGNENDFIDFVKKIVVENEDHDYSVIGLSDAKEYIEDYCGNLEWREIPLAS